MGAGASAFSAETLKDDAKLNEFMSGLKDDELTEFMKKLPASQLERITKAGKPSGDAPGQIKFKDLMQELDGAQVPKGAGAIIPEEFAAAEGGDNKIAIFSSSPYVKSFLKPLVDKFPGSFFIDENCSPESAHKCKGATIACLFVNDFADKQVMNVFKSNGVKMIALRCAGFDRIDLEAAEEVGIQVARVPAYSPYAVAEQALSLACTLNRKIHRANQRVREGNLGVNGLVGMDLYGKTCGIIGTGIIGYIAAKIFKGVGMNVICYDVFKNAKITDELGLPYVELDELYAKSDIISLHVPLLPDTTKMIDSDAIDKMKKGVILINCSRGGLVSTNSLIRGIRSGKIGGAGLDVYENEHSLFFKDFSCMADKERMASWDEKFALLRALPNVLITPHSAFLTQEALTSICNTTIANAEEFKEGKPLTNVVKPKAKAAPKANPALERRPSKIASAPLESSQTGGYASLPVDNGAVAQLVASNPDVKVAVFSAQPYVKDEMKALMAKYPNSFFVEAACSPSTAALCGGAKIVNLFVNDSADKEVISIFKSQGVELITLRCAGFDRVDLAAAAEAGIKVVRVPAYSPYAVAEHALSLCLCVNRRLHRCYQRVKEDVYTLSGLVGMDLNGKTCGIAGTGLIGSIACDIFRGIGMNVICYDKFPNDKVKEKGFPYVELDELYAQSDVISLHVPLLPATTYMINAESIAKMKSGVILINCGRGKLVQTTDLIQGLESGKIGGVGLDVYENEADIFFSDFTSMSDEERMQKFDPTFAVLKSFPNAVITPHTAFLTDEALANICNTTIENIEQYVVGEDLKNEVKPPPQ